MSSLSHYDPTKGCFVLKNLKPKPPANAFEYMRFTEEERARRGGQPVLAPNDYQRSAASTRAVEKKREEEPRYGTIGISSKTAAMVALKPKTFAIYSKAIKKGVP